MSESFADLFEESLKRSEMRTGEVITAEVVRVEHNHVVVNAGLKSEAYVPIEEFKNDKGEVEVQAGDFVSVAIGSVENGYGDTILSRDTAKVFLNAKHCQSIDEVYAQVQARLPLVATVLVKGSRFMRMERVVQTIQSWVNAKSTTSETTEVPCS